MVKQIVTKIIALLADSVVQVNASAFCETITFHVKHLKKRRTKQ
nr:MAG TPA: hypothetical protein [Caudoviricetes sp.]